MTLPTPATEPLELVETGPDHWVVRGADGDTDVTLHRAANPRAVVVLPFYEVDSPWGRRSERNPDLPDAERPRRAHGAILAEADVDVLTVGWWAETCLPGDLDERYGAAAARRRDAGRGDGISRTMADILAAVDLYESLGRADVVLGFGHSLGAKHTLSWAAIDPRPQAIALSEPGFYPDTNNWDAPWYYGPGRRDVDDLLAAVAGRRVLVIGGGDADDERALAHATGILGEGGEYLLHDHGHQPPPHVVAAARAWLLDGLR